MEDNSSLILARKAKNDEFYTQYNDIEAEMNAYVEYNPNVFRDKTVLLPCDDPEWSNFTKYFVANFERFGLKKLISTSYAQSAGNKQMTLFNSDKHNTHGKLFTLTRDKDGSGTQVSGYLKGNGDFRSDECLALLDESDIVVTNPPFSLFREYVATLIEHEKKFIIIGNVNAITYKKFFPLLKENKVWIGASIHSGGYKFYVPDDYPLKAADCGIDDDGRRYIRVKGIRWYTNLDLEQRHEELILVKRYVGHEEDYPHFDNYPNVINVDRVKDIPCDYAGVMGVPITFLDKYNPDQFEILEGSNRYGVLNTLGKNAEIKAAHSHGNNIQGKATYFRIFIRNKHLGNPF